MLPFTHDQFLAVFAAYNRAIWPAQLVAYLLGAGMVVAIARRARPAGVFAAFGLAAMWAWTGVAYQALRFTRINPAAWGFAALFLVQAAVFAWAGRHGRLAFGPVGALRAWTGWGLIAYALVLYPAAGIAFGGSYPALPLFGVTPCPVTLFTLGILSLAERAPARLLVIPTAWALVGGSAAFLLQVVQDWVLLASALAVIPIAMARRVNPSETRRY